MSGLLQPRPWRCPRAPAAPSAVAFAPFPQLMLSCSQVCKRGSGTRRHQHPPICCRPVDRVAKFGNVHTLTLHFQGTFGSDQSEITFIGLKGDFSEVGTSCFPLGLPPAGGRGATRLAAPAGPPPALHARDRWKGAFAAHPPHSCSQAQTEPPTPRAPPSSHPLRTDPRSLPNTRSPAAQPARGGGGVRAAAGARGSPGARHEAGRTL